MAVTLLASITLVPALLGVFHSKVEVTRWRGLLSAGCIALALLGVGLGLPTLSAIGGVFAIVTLLGSIAIRPLRKEVPPRRERPLRETSLVSVEPANPAQTMAVCSTWWRTSRTARVACVVASSRIF